MCHTFLSVNKHQSIIAGKNSPVIFIYLVLFQMKRYLLLHVNLQFIKNKKTNTLYLQSSLKLILVLVSSWIDLMVLPPLPMTTPTLDFGIFVSIVTVLDGFIPVSYTHLDVYKRQLLVGFVILSNPKAFVLLKYLIFCQN